MNDSNKEQPAINTDRTKSIEAVQATTSAARRKRWHFIRLIVLVSLIVIAAIIFASRYSVLAQRYEGLGAALCAIACGGLLVRHALRMFAGQDKLEE